MDLVLELFDAYAFDRVYATLLPAQPFPGQTASGNASIPRSCLDNYDFKPASQYLSFPPSELACLSQWSRDNVWRQWISLYIITWLFGTVIYFACATFSYIFIFDKTTFAHPKFLKNQVRLEIAQAVRAIPIIAVFTTPIFLLEVRGYSKMYDSSAAGPGLWYDVLQYPLFICFTDFFIYWIHRYLHHPSVYRRFHKPHHKWIMPSPFASVAFHPVDGFAQSLPYHVYPFLFPLQKFAYIALFAFVQVWTVVIHDGEYVAENPVVNGAACHTMHHLYFNYNYGQFTTLWDRVGGSYRRPDDALFQKELKQSKTEWEKQSRQMEDILKVVEGDDERSYAAGGAAEKKAQ
ncbi:putative Delta(7)-sterol 5(6)-desaturase [Lasiodiplodia hormozganensis]|uniref:Delta(7)-sterol 5(6)-desaturase n=1 Tax=Lasiodiplodia hormozganensis TaxID=869390 RepID=A0AA39YK22_9PEZI|nr:putative Delta(7)-sterol 5(6)-desaturase [Lasiodiplodia hormozganensis]